MLLGGYAVFLYLKNINCNNCVLQLTQNKDNEISETTKYDLVRYIDRGSLNWPSGIAIESLLYCGRYSTRLMVLKL